MRSRCGHQKTSRKPWVISACSSLRRSVRMISNSSGIMCAEEGKWHGKIVEIKVDSNINFDWSHANLDKGWDRGYHAAGEALKKYYA